MATIPVSVEENFGAGDDGKGQFVRVIVADTQAIFRAGLRKVFALEADGSAMYSLQALWTMAREGLNITTVIFANRAYSVLKREFSNLGIGEPGAKASSLFDIGRPDLDWVSLAKGMGVPAERVISLDEFSRLLRTSFDSSGPKLIEVPI